jgi:hypothetical protein
MVDLVAKKKMKPADPRYDPAAVDLDATQGSKNCAGARPPDENAGGAGRDAECSRDSLRDSLALVE